MYASVYHALSRLMHLSKCHSEPPRISNQEQQEMAAALEIFGSPDPVPTQAWLRHGQHDEVTRRIPSRTPR